MSSPVAVILNLASGARDTRALAEEVTQSFAAEGIDAAIATVPASDIPRATQRALDAGSRVIVAGGGDGTVSTIAALVAGTDAVLGVLPLGTLNHFAKDLGIPTGIPDAVRTIAAGHVLTTDMGEANGRRFINNVSVGLYPSVVSEREKRRKSGRRKWIALALASLQVWREYRRVRVAIRTGNKNRVMRTPFVFVGNNEYRLDGISFGARNTLSRGYLHICAAPEMTRMEVVGVLMSSLAGRLHRFEHFESFCATELSIHARRQHLAVSVDGELAVFTTPIRFRTLRAALRVLAPPPAATE